MNGKGLFNVPYNNSRKESIDEDAIRDISLYLKNVEILEGDFPTKQLKMLEGWMAIHEDELAANWRMLSDGDGYFKIDPLR